MLDENKIIEEMIPNIASKYGRTIGEADLSYLADDLNQDLKLFYLRQKQAGKFRGRGIGYIRKSLDNYAIDKIRASKKRFKDLHGEADIEIKLVSDDNVEIDDLSYQKDLEDVKTEYSLFPTADVPFTDWRKQLVRVILPPSMGRGNFVYEEDKYRPTFPSDYKREILVSDLFQEKPFIQEQLKRLEKSGALKPLVVKTLFTSYLKRIAREANGWKKVDWFSYEGAATRFCETWKYSNWQKLKDYAAEFRKETGIQAEYFYHNQLIESIRKITQAGKKATLTRICESLGLKQNHVKVCYYLEYLVNAQKVRRKTDKIREFYTI